MNEPLALIDTDILIFMLRQSEPAYQKSVEYLAQNECFYFSCITYYECFRGYKALGASKKLSLFEQLLDISKVLYLDQPILEKASGFYATLKKSSVKMGEFDLLIAATAATHQMKIITNNEKHYMPFSEHFGLEIENWMK